jgi:hypothetical protein
MLARQLEAAADIADDINVPILKQMKLTSIAQSWNGIVGDVDPE